MRRHFEIRLSDKSLKNQSLHTNIEELEQFLRAEGTEKRKVRLDFTDNPEVTDVDSDPGEGVASLVWCFSSARSACVWHGALLTLSSWALQRGSTSSLCPELMSPYWLCSVQSRSATGIQSSSCCGCRGQDRIGSSPKCILAKAFNDVECDEVLTETPELRAAQAAMQGRIK